MGKNNNKKALEDETDQLVHKIINEGVDAIIAGWPCQDISIAGLGAGLSGERSGLWRYLFRAIRLVKPRRALLENVAALLFRGMGEILGDLARIGYDAEWHCIQASDIGLPHARKRVYTIAYPHSQRRQRCWPQAIQGESGISWCENVRGFEDLPKRSNLYPSQLCGGGNGISQRLDGIGNANPPDVIKQIINSWDV